MRTSSCRGICRRITLAPQVSMLGALCIAANPPEPSAAMTKAGGRGPALLKCPPAPLPTSGLLHARHPHILPQGFPDSPCEYPGAVSAAPECSWLVKGNEVKY